MCYAIPTRTHLYRIVRSTINTAASVTTSPVTTVTTTTNTSTTTTTTSTTTSTNTINLGKRQSPLILRPQM
jgi:hypothetical protein